MKEFEISVSDRMKRSEDVSHETNPRLSVVLLAYNEEIHIKRALFSVNPLKPNTFVVDSASGDCTATFAGAFGAQVVEHPFVTQSQQFQWALDNLPIESEWVMRLDADETLTPELIEEIRRRLPGL
ncbi:MAG: hypothetical protein P4L81_06010, partial [Candidatus Pacebacteria bacterium]|nr:hypothetical protein [Candidatus Paceibacterota bacterium]